MALPNAMSDIATDSDTPSLLAPGEVVLISDDNKVLANDGAQQGNIEPFPPSNTMEHEPSQSSGESQREAPPRTLPAVGNPYRNPVAYNQYRQNLDRHRTGGASRAPNFIGPPMPV